MTVVTLVTVVTVVTVVTFLTVVTVVTVVTLVTAGTKNFFPKNFLQQKLFTHKKKYQKTFFTKTIKLKL